MTYNECPCDLASIKVIYWIWINGRNITPFKSTNSQKDMDIILCELNVNCNKIKITCNWTNIRWDKEAKFNQTTDENSPFLINLWYIMLISLFGCFSFCSSWRVEVNNLPAIYNCVNYWCRVKYTKKEKRGGRM